MANDFSSNPFEMDTVVADFSDQTKVWPGFALVDHFEMVHYDADADTATVVDRNGRVAWEANGEGDLSPVRSGKIGVVYNGLRLATKTSAGAVVRVYIK